MSSPWRGFAVAWGCSLVISEPLVSSVTLPCERDPAWPIIGFAAGNGGRLPSVEQADALLAKVNKRLGFYSRRVGKIEFVVERHVYEQKDDGIFEIRYEWSCDHEGPGVPSSGGDGPVTGVVTIDFTASGLTIMDRKNGEIRHPLAEVLEAFSAKGLPAANARSSSTDAGG